MVSKRKSAKKKSLSLGARSKTPTKRERADDDDELRARRRRGRSVRARGGAFEREIANALKEFFPNARRLLENHKDDCVGTDLLNTGHYRIQCKRKKAYASFRALEEVICDEDIAGEVPVLIAKADRGRTLVAIPFEEFLQLLRESRRSASLR